MPDSNDKKPSSTAPSERLSQVAGHVAPKTRRKSKAKDDLPADYSDILGQLEKLRTIASTPDPKNKGYVRQKQSGKLWVRLILPLTRK
jgi:hypothetical protein